MLNVINKTISKKNNINALRRQGSRSKESIANRLEKKLAKLKKETDAITTVGSLQIQYLLLR